MRRRRLVATSTAMLLAPALACAQGQAARPVRIGYLSAFEAPDRDVDALRAGLRTFGHVEGASYTLEIRYAERRLDRFGALLDELLATGIAVLAVGGAAWQVASRAGQRVPVVFAMSGDPVEAGIIASLPRPGGNVTGISFLALDLVPKRLSLLKEAAPGIRRVGVVSNPQHAGERNERRVTEEAAHELGIEIVYRQIRDEADIVPALAAIRDAGCDGLTAFPEALTSAAAARLADFAIENAMPSVFGWRNFAAAGGLMSYGPVRHDTYARMGYFIDRILRGARPADLPAELPRSIELVINQRTARRLDLTIPHILASRADEVIE
ncbi:MAG: ABC transporter substrate-binding protein [Alphaproteobacteria bacterium]|nr:ABC transporter substrate-binding protein [Alphaproteobacteria bacterium]